MKTTGTVRQWDATRRFGFIRTEGSQDVFFHVRDWRAGFEPQVGTVACDVARLLQPLDADEAGTGRQAYCVGQIHIGHPAVLLQLAQNAQVQAVDLEGFVHHGVQGLEEKSASILRLRRGL